MTVLVDTPVWSFAYRRAKRTAREQTVVDALTYLIRRERAVLIGSVRQELLSGISDPNQFESVRLTLRGFDELRVVTSDYERAATYHSLCRRKGVQGSPTDFLICAVSVRCNVQVFTTDKDFQHYTTHTGVSLFEIPNR